MQKCKAISLRLACTVFLFISHLSCNSIYLVTASAPIAGYRKPHERPSPTDTLFPQKYYFPHLVPRQSDKRGGNLQTHTRQLDFEEHCSSTHTTTEKVSSER